MAFLNIRIEEGAVINSDMWDAIYLAYVDPQEFEGLDESELITHLIFEPVRGYDGVQIKASDNGFRFKDWGFLHTDGEFATFPQDVVN